MRGYSSLTVV